MSELHILDVGRADCTVLLLDTPQGRRTVVVDGGGKYREDRRPLLEFLTRRNLTVIDLLILTHLHQDHFGGFVHLVDRVRVRRAVAPCGDLRFADRGVSGVRRPGVLPGIPRLLSVSGTQRNRTHPFRRLRRAGPSLSATTAWNASIPSGTAPSAPWPMRMHCAIRT